MSKTQTIDDTLAIWTVDAPTHLRHLDTIEVFDCRCGNTIRADEQTVCMDCSRYYRRACDEMHEHPASKTGKPADSLSNA